MSTVSVCIALFVTQSLYFLLSLFFLLGIFSYFLIKNLLNYFVYRKIKLIFKLISSTKSTLKEEYYQQELLPQKNIDEIKTDVEQWAIEKKKEIDRIESNEQFRKEFLMNLAHELKTPIFTTQGYIHTLLDGAIHDSNVNEKFLQSATKSIDRLAELVNDLDEISKLESERTLVNKSNFSIHKLIHTVFQEFEQMASAKQITLRIKAGCEKNINVYADEPKIKQVLVNLIENSIKYGKLIGTTSVGIYVVDKKNILIEVNDNGPGIAAEHIPRVFERFFRTDQARSRDKGGTGLGLAIVKHIIEAHNHTVMCRSKLDVGTTFAFTLDNEQNNKIM